jgi:hypothetical protein
MGAYNTRCMHGPHGKVTERWSATSQKSLQQQAGAGARKAAARHFLITYVPVMPQGSPQGRCLAALRQVGPQVGVWGLR